MVGKKNHFFSFRVFWVCVCVLRWGGENLRYLPYHNNALGSRSGEWETRSPTHRGRRGESNVADLESRCGLRGFVWPRNRIGIQMGNISEAPTTNTKKAEHISTTHSEENAVGGTSHSLESKEWKQRIKCLKKNEEKNTISATATHDGGLPTSKKDVTVLPLKLGFECRSINSRPQ